MKAHALAWALALGTLCTARASAQSSDGGPAGAMPIVPPGYESGAALASPTRPVDPRVPIDPAIETERPPGLAPSAPAAGLGHVAPIRLADRPLTLTEGTGRIDHGILLQGGFGITTRMNLGFTLGVTEDLEIGLSWPIEGDPTLQTTGRLFHNEFFELGVRGAVMIPAITTGNTNARVGVPMMLHGGPVRFFVVPEVDLLFTANVSVLLAVPAQLSITLGRVFSVGSQGWIGLVDGRVAQGDVFGFVNMTAHNGHRALMDARIAMGYAPAEGHFLFTTSLSFYPQFW